MNPILSALSQGYSAKTILRYLTQVDPALASRINLALNTGYTADAVLKHLYSGGKKISKLLPEEGSNNLYKQAQSKLAPEAKNALKLGALGAGAGLGYLGMRSLASAGGAIIPEVLPALQGQPQIGFNQPAQIPPIAPLPTSPTPPTGGVVGNPLPSPSGQINIAPPTPQIPQINPQEALNIVGQTRLGSNFRNIGPLIQPENIATAMRALYGNKDVAQIEKETKLPFDELIQKAHEALLQSQPVQQAPQEPLPPIEQPIQQEQLPIEEPPQEETLPVQEEVKSKIVLTPKGDVGTIVSEKGKTVKLDIDGKTKVFNKKDLEESPLHEKDLADLMQDLINGIEKETGQEVSKNVELAGYDPEEKELIYKPHLGPIYVYKNISKERADQLTSLLTLRKTSGENFMGAWVKETKSPIGAAMSNLINELKKETEKGSKEYHRKYETLYSSQEPAQLALRKRKKELADKLRKEKKDEKRNKKK